MKRVRFLTMLLAFILLGVFLPQFSRAQTTVSIDSVSVDASNVRIYFSGQKSGVAFYPGDVGKSNLRLRDNGDSVTAFTVKCGSHTVTELPVSTALLIDRSGSSDTAMRFLLAQYGALRFISAMDTAKGDETAVISFNDKTTIDQSMINRRDSLANAVSRLFPYGMTALWDAVKVAVNHVSDSGTNAAKCIVLFSDGGDNSSHLSTYQQAIALAVAKRVRVFSIGMELPPGSIQEQYLEYLAAMTGGSYFNANDSLQMRNALLDARAQMMATISSCELEYDLPCLDGVPHTIELAVDTGGGAFVTDTASFVAPLDKSTFDTLHVITGSVTTLADEVIRIPLTLTNALGSNTSIPACVWTFEYDATALHFESIYTAGLHLYGASIQTDTTVPGQVTFSVAKTIIPGYPGALCELRFTAKKKTAYTSVQCALQNWTFSKGCWMVDATPGTVEVFPSPEIQSQSTVAACEGDTITLSGPLYYQYYNWSTGETTRSIQVTQSGKYILLMQANNNLPLRSDTVHVAFHARPAAAITGAASGCTGEQNSYSATTHPGWNYSWRAEGGIVLQGSTTPSIDIEWGTGPLGKVILTVNNGGCIDSIEYSVAIHDIPKPVIEPAGLVFICAGDTAVLTLQGQYPRIDWLPVGHSQFIEVITSGMYRVMVENEYGCRDTSDYVEVIVYPSPSKPPIVRTGDSLVTNPNAQYQWMFEGAQISGSIDRAHVALSPGYYQVAIIDSNGCEAISDTYYVGTLDAPSPEHAGAFQLRAFPTETSGTVNLEILDASQNTTLRVVDALGRVVQVMDIVPAGRQSQTAVDLTGNAAGIYIIQASSGANTATVKIVLR